MAKTKKSNQPTRQVSAFKKAARELECDESEAAFDKKLRKIAKAWPKPKGK